MTSAVILFNWTGEAMVPARGHAKRCDEKFTVGELYRLEVSEERSHRSHRHYFAAVHEAWMNLPEKWAARFPSPDHLRKWALITTGFCTCRELAFDSNASAQIGGEAFREADPYAVIIVNKATVIVYRAQSQSLKAMGKADFQRSKDLTLGKISEKLGVTIEDLKERAKVTA